MTLVGDIIDRAFRESNLLGELNHPTPQQGREGLVRLQTIVSSALGNEAGEPLTALPVGRDNITRPAGYPSYNTTVIDNWFVPKNARIVFNLENSLDIYLHPKPDNGSRFGVIDASGNLATFPVTIYGNGRTIDGGLTTVLNENSVKAEWFYRDDLGEWLKTLPLTSGMDFPFPEEFDDYFITLLALRLNPAYGNVLDSQSQAALIRSRTQLRARYRQNKPTSSELGLLRMSNLSDDRYLRGTGYWLDDPSDLFDIGYPFG